MQTTTLEPFVAQTFLRTAGPGRSVETYGKNRAVFAQGDPADAVLYLRSGKIKLTVLSPHGKEAIVAMLGSGSFFGEGCLSDQPLRNASASTLLESSILTVSKAEMQRTLRAQPAFAEMFIAHLLTRNLRIEADLVDHLFNSSEKRLARILLLLANFGQAGDNPEVIPHISQETLARMVGTTRSRVNFFMTKFRKLGFIEGTDALHVNASLLNVVLHD